MIFRDAQFKKGICEAGNLCMEVGEGEGLGGVCINESCEIGIG